MQWQDLLDSGQRLGARIGRCHRSGQAQQDRLLGVRRAWSQRAERRGAGDTGKGAAAPDLGTSGSSRFVLPRDFIWGDTLPVDLDGHGTHVSGTIGQLTNNGTGWIYEMAFGNGGSAVDPTGVITYLPPNTTGQNADLYNETYAKVVDDNSAADTDPNYNKMTVLHTSGNVYTDILVSCLLDYSEPSGQSAFDNSQTLADTYTFDELGLNAYYGTDASGAIQTRLLTHVIFHPIQKALNRQIQIDYTLRIQTLTNLVTT